MESESLTGSDNGRDNGIESVGNGEEPLLEVSGELQELLNSLSEDQRKLWDEAVEGWLEPAERLAAMRAELETGVAPAYHVPSAEGVAVYQGMFGPNGALTDDDKKLVAQLVTEVVSSGGKETGGSEDESQFDSQSTPEGTT